MIPCNSEFCAYALVRQISDECVSTKLRVTGNHTCFILVILNCISLYTHVLSTFQQHLLQFPTIIYVIKNLLFILITYLVDIVLILSGEIPSWSLMGVKVLTVRHCWAVVLNSMNINQFQLTGFCGYFLDSVSLFSNV